MPVLLHAGYLKWLPPKSTTDSPTNASNGHHLGMRSKFSNATKKPLRRQPALVDRYCELYGRRLCMFLNHDKKQQSNSFDIRGFCQWKGDGILSTDSYGLELKIAGNSNIFVAAFNRLDLENWNRAFLAALNPKSSAAEDLRRTRKKERREKRKKEKAIEEQKKILRERRAKELELERLKELRRAEEITRMTPLERADGLGTLDEDTAKILERRKKRRQRRQTPTTGRVTRNAFKKRLDDGVGGRIENVQPLAHRTVDFKQRVKVEAPPPGQFYEAVDIDRASESDSSVSSDSDSPYDGNDRRSSFASSVGSSRSFRPPPPPSESRSSFKHSDSYNENRSSEVYSSSESSSEEESSEYSEEEERPRNNSRIPLPPPTPSLPPKQPPPPPPKQPPPPPPEPSPKYSKPTHPIDSNTQSQDPRSAFANSLSNLISRKDSRTESHLEMRSSHSSNRYKNESRDRAPSYASSLAPSTIDETQDIGKDMGSSGLRSRTSSVASMRRQSHPAQVNLANILSGSRRNGSIVSRDIDNDSQKPSSPFSGTHPSKRNRSRQQQLSDEGKNILVNAMSSKKNDMQVESVIESKQKSTGGSIRKGLFDDSSESEDDEEPIAVQKPAVSNAHSKGGKKNTGRELFEDGDDDEDDDDSDRSPSISPIRLPQKKSPMQSAKPQRKSIFESYSTSEDDDDEVVVPSPAVSRVSSSRQPISRASSSHSIYQARSSMQSTSTPHQMNVKFITSSINQDGKKKQAVYTFEFSFGGLRHQFTYSYHEMEEIHSRLQSKDTLPKLPSKHVFRNNLKEEFRQKRGMEFENYFKKLILLSDIVSSERFHFEYKMQKPFIDALNGQQRIPETSISSSQRNSKSPPKSQLFSPSNVSNSENESDSSVEAPQPQSPIPKSDSSPKKQRKPSIKSPLTSTPKLPTSLADQIRNVNMSSPKKESPKQATEVSETKIASKKASKLPTGVPSRANPFGGGRGNLLSQIRKGTDLTHREENSSPVNIASRSSPRTNPPPTESDPLSISDAISTAMAARRVRVEAETRSSFDSDANSEDWS